LLITKENRLSQRSLGGALRLKGYSQLFLERAVQFFRNNANVLDV